MKNHSQASNQGKENNGFVKSPSKNITVILKKNQKQKKKNKKKKSHSNMDQSANQNKNIQKKNFVFGDQSESKNFEEISNITHTKIISHSNFEIRVTKKNKSVGKNNLNGSHPKNNANQEQQEAISQTDISPQKQNAKIRDQSHLSDKEKHQKNASQRKIDFQEFSNENKNDMKSENGKKKTHSFSHFPNCPFSFLPENQSNKKRKLKRPNLGELLVNFFKYFGEFNFVSHGVTADGIFSKEERGNVDENIPWKLIVDDPITPNNNLGSATFHVLTIREFFKECHNILMDENCKSNTLLTRIILVDPLLDKYRSHINYHFGEKPIRNSKYDRNYNNFSNYNNINSNF